MSIISNIIAAFVAKWLIKDFALNIEAASSTHLYEPPLPKISGTQKD